MNALMFHDIVEVGAEDASGFTGRDAALYKVTPERFEQQMAGIARLAPERRPAVTFDDGGVSAMNAADALERHGLTGFFFVTVDFIGASGFINAHQIGDLHRRGHIVGSHSCSHPLRMAHCSPGRLLDEWTRSRTALSRLIGNEVTVASIPGGEFSPAVAEAAAQAGITVLFTSEPTRATRVISGLRVRGRFTIRHHTSVHATMNLARDGGLAAARQQIAWTLKKLSKRLVGARYLEFRRLVLGGTLK